MSHHPATKPSDRSAHSLARALGWFSLGLGLAEVVAPKALARWLGMPNSEGLIRLYGAREIGTGLGILGSTDPSPWVWGRVGGDALDLATLTGGLDQDNPNKGNVGLALAAVGGVAALDIVCASNLSRSNGYDTRRGRSTALNYRSGFNASPEVMRGAARDFKVPDDFRVPKPLRSWTES